MAQFGQLAQPPLSPPAWLFPVAWTILYALMGLSSYLLWSTTPTSTLQKRTRLLALVVYAAQLALNFIWSPIFFGAQAYWTALAVLFAMWMLILVLIVLAKKLNKLAAYLLVPYLAWTTFAAYLNLGVGLLN